MSRFWPCSTPLSKCYHVDSMLSFWQRVFLRPALPVSHMKTPGNIRQSRWKTLVPSHLLMWISTAMRCQWLTENNEMSHYHNFPDLDEWVFSVGAKIVHCPLNIPHVIFLLGLCVFQPKHFLIKKITMTKTLIKGRMYGIRVKYCSFSNYVLN